MNPDLVPDLAPVDLAIIGAGPAGIAAAVEAAEHGLSVLLLDENAAPGGRIWQGLEARGAADVDEAAALMLMRRLRASPVDRRWNAAVWAMEPGAIEPDGQVFWSEPGIGSRATRTATARKILLATGTTERPLPIPGWTLPGVMTIGAAQIALKTGGLRPSGRTWLAGQGPLLLLYAVQALEAGGAIAGVIDLSDGLSPIRALRHTSLAVLADIRKGLAWRRRLSEVRWIAAAELRAEGETALRAVSFRTVRGWQRQDADLLLLHDGVIPSVQMSRAVGCAHAWSEVQRSWRPVADAWGQTSVRHVLVAGDGAGIGGAAAAVLSGRIAALGAACALGRLDPMRRDAVAAPLRARHRRLLAGRPLLDRLFAPVPMRLDDTTLVCRCEEVSAGDVRQAARAGCGGMNQLKAYTRCGMGPCQGRMCGPVAIEVLAAAHGVPVAAIEPLRTRFPTKPVSLADLVSLRAEQDTG
ncbi:FAD-dependent oxidoreductase [Rhodopila sp.]|uniref:FAD-dependent oxidoreductase n=1 Tax=Rhodopila sp. TaxID=2480087 RepID=UPI003D0D54F7